MPIPDQVIAEAVARYARERDRYLKLAALVADICRSDIVESNVIRAQVTSRAKSIKSFEGKLKRLSKKPEKSCTTVDEVFAKIGDLAGVRIATYQPESEDRVIEEVQKRFSGTDGENVSVEKKDKLPEGFYRAIHCQVFLLADELVGTYENLKGTSCEIQVCSMMTHVWNEIEHDIGYKPEGGGPEATEKGLLQALGHLTRSGDKIITQLLVANAARLEMQTGDFEEIFDFVARLRPFFPDVDLSLYAGQLFEETQDLGLTSVEKLKKEIGETEFTPDVAKRKIADFNKYLREKRAQEYTLDDKSSDVILIFLLERFAEKIEENHPAGRGMGRPPRIGSIARRFRQYLAEL